VTSKTYVFIDASNIIYGTRDEGWKVDFKKLYKYLRERYSAKIIYYFGGKDENNEKQVGFYKLLDKIGFELILKPVKIFKQENGHQVRKANCDVDLTFYAMRDFTKYSRGIFLTGDGDFEILLKYLIKQKKEVKVIANGKRTAREIKSLVGADFVPIKSLQAILEYRHKKGRTLRTTPPHVL